MGVLRFFLALSVANEHGRNLLGFPLLSADLAVQAFFMISGFYMAMVLHEKYTPGETSYFDFIASRFLRIFPGYFLVIVLIILMLLGFGQYYGNSIGPFILWSQNWDLLDWTAKFYLVSSHLTLFGQGIQSFLGLAGGALYFDSSWSAHHNTFFRFMLMPQAWSLSLELCFYLLAPFLVRRSITALALMITASLAVRLALAIWLGWNDDPWSYRFFPSELAVFLCGAIAYRIYRLVRAGEMNTRSWLGWCATGLAASAALLINRYANGWAVWLNVGFVVTMFMFLPFLFKLTKNSVIDRHLGELSYPMYLCHWMVIWLFTLMQFHDGLAKSVGVLSVTLMLSIAIYWFVDRYIDNFRHRKFPASPNSVKLI